MIMTKEWLKTLTLSATTLVFCVACGSGSSSETDGDDFQAPGEDREFIVPEVIGEVSDDVFDPSRLIQVYMDMPDADFALLRSEGRALSTALSECPSTDFEYTDFKATVNIDGTHLEEVAIRKKGYLGSISSSRPSIKLNFDTHVDGRTYKTMKRMTLNNDRQDPSHTHQCMAYDLYRAAGLVAPRCNLAHVVINGEDLGVYTQVESIKKPFLELNYDDKGGNLYEGQVADFGAHLNEKFELKTNKTENDRSDLDELSAILAMDDENLLANLPSKLALDEFITYWAVETLIGHWDSATGNANNFYIYHDPTDDLFHFIPWGTDAAFTGVNVFKPNGGPLYRNLSIASRLYAIDETRQLYFDAINNLLTLHWNEADLLAKVDAIREVSGAPEEADDAMKIFIAGYEDLDIRSQRERLESAMNGLEPEQTEYLLQDVAQDCDEPAPTTTITGSFNSNGALGDEGSFTFTNAQGETIVANMTLVTFSGVDSLIYELDDTTLPGVVNLTLIGAGAPPAYQPYALQLFVESPSYTEGDHSLHGIVTNMMLFKAFEDESIPIIFMGAGQSGTISLELTGDGSADSPIKGSIDATISIIDISDQ
jgi:hypothetical protein